MKKAIISSLILSLIPGFCLGVNDRIYKLMQEKQAKMEKLEKCQGTTKNLKIAGISTLGITAVGVGANIAEAVVLNDYKSDVAKAKDARDAQLKIKEEREKAELARQNALMSAATTASAPEQSKYVVKIDFRHESLSYADAAEKVMQWGRTNGQSFSDCGYRHDNESDYITCKNTDSKIWMFKFNAILDRQAEVKGVQSVTINKTTLPYEEAIDDINAWAAKNKVDVFACSQKGKDKIACGGETVDYEFTFGLGAGTITTDGTKYTSQSICQKHCSGTCLEERDSTGRWDCVAGGNNADAAAKKAEENKKVADAINSLGKDRTIPVNGVFQLVDAEKYVKDYGVKNGITLSDCSDYNNGNYILCGGPNDTSYTFTFDKIMRDNKTLVIHQPDNRTIDQILKDNGYDAAAEAKKTVDKEDALVPGLVKELEEEEAQKKAEQDQAAKDFTDAQAKHQAATAELEQMKNNANKN